MLCGTGLISLSLILECKVDTPQEVVVGVAFHGVLTVWAVVQIHGVALTVAKSEPWLYADVGA